MTNKILDDIVIKEKPEWVSWDEIKLCLVNAHSVNRAKGINMSHYQWSANQIQESIGVNGVMLVAMAGEKVVGTLALIEKYGHSWYAPDRYAFLGFAGVLPEYSGRGIYSGMANLIEKIAADRKIPILVFDTHEKNKRMRKISTTNGYRLVHYFRVKNRDHYNVIMAKWIDGSSYSQFYCWYRFFFSMDSGSGICDFVCDKREAY